VTMRVWLVEDSPGDAAAPLASVLRQLAADGDRLTLRGAGPFRPALLADLGGWQLDLIVTADSAWPDGPEGEDLAGLDAGLVVVTEAPRCQRFLALAEVHAVGLVHAPPRPEDLWLALLTTLAARRRHLAMKAQAAELQQRLADRIVIERAKGILVQRLGVTEDEAYKRLRVSSRRQRRPIRDIAQSLLDTEALFLPENNGFADSAGLDTTPGASA
jgi:hypothetical protein